MNWFYLLLAILLEVAGTASMKFSGGLTKIVPSILMVPFYAASFTFLAFSLKASMFQWPMRSGREWGLYLSQSLAFFTSGSN